MRLSTNALFAQTLIPEIGLLLRPSASALLSFRDSYLVMLSLYSLIIGLGDMIFRASGQDSPWLIVRRTHPVLMILHTNRLLMLKVAI